MNIFLIGYRCVGKTSVGKALAATLSLSFIDSDVEITKEYGMTVSEIVQKQGWESFRKKEKKIIKKICALNNYVVATGGGVVLDDENIRQMQKNGRIIWLKASSETITKRMLEDKNTKNLRPSLTSKGVINEIEDTLLSRLPYYKKAMDFSTETDNFDIDEICAKIAETDKHRSKICVHQKK